MGEMADGVASSGVVPLSFVERICVTAPGPELAAALSRLDLSRLSSSDLFAVMAARARQVAHDQALLLADMLAAARSGPSWRGQLDEFSADQLAFELSWSRIAATAHLDLAQQLIERFPDVYTELLAGRIDLPKAWAFVEALNLLPDAAAARVAGEVIAQAERLTVGQIRDRLRYRAMKADPGLAAARTRRSVTDRRVYANLDSEGTASLGGVCLPPDRAAAAHDRVHRLAGAAKASGDSRTLAQLRADAMLALLIGDPFTVRPPRDEHTRRADAEVNANAEVNATTNTNINTEAERLCVESDNSMARPFSDIEGTLPHVDDVAASPPARGARPVLGAGRCRCGGVQPAPRRGVVDIVVGLATLAKLREDPAILPGWGPVIADIARQVAHSADSQWRYSVMADDGTLVHHGHTRHRPHDSWDRRRVPRGRDRATINARDRVCRAKGCRQPASRCDQDHRTPHAWGGEAHPANMTVLCRHHHRLRHERGFTVTETRPGHFLWVAPNKRRYVATPHETPPW